MVTERRAIIFRKGWSVHVQSFETLACSGFERVTAGAPSGSIIFQCQRHTRSPKEIGFIGLASYAEAENALREMIRRTQPQPTT
jgi:hypothetical protein